MFCLVYKSKAISNLSLIQIEVLLEKSRLFNSANNISGCLLYYEGEFLQYLEGNQIKVLTLFDKISLDKLHTNVKLLSHGLIEKREFNNWSMAFKNVHGQNDQLQYIELLVDSFLDKEAAIQGPNPTSKKFWKTTKGLLDYNRSLNLLE
ncbi:BLUF domain-containing protein [Flavobacteriaceae bacterium KMM 6897]|nr:BLUF domain-containing protein [Flavobacteriaceae bacterium KMM 6897]MEB8345421.1 BLUF domain-containing protein [Flavobacteriaceae bacterium KMM 6898]